MNIIFKSIEDIKPYENNPRINDKAVKHVKKSIKRFGFKNPIIVDSDGIIICGHTRYKASIELGLEEVPCIIADDLTEKQIKAYRLADNKTGEIAEWDIELLSLELDELKLDFDMQDFGFDMFQDSEISEESKESVPEDLSDKVKSTFEVIVTCADEEDLENTYNALTEEGYQCRVLTL